MVFLPFGGVEVDKPIPLLFLEFIRGIEPSPCDELALTPMIFEVSPFKDEDGDSTGIFSFSSRC